MKNLYFLLAILLIATSLHAQKVDLDGEPLTVQYLRLPERPFPPAYKFYSAIVSSKPGDLSALGMSEGTLLKYLVVPGYKRINQGGNFNLELTLEDFKYEGPYEVKTEKSTTKDKNGKETTTTSYFTLSHYKQPIILKIRNEEGKTIEERKWYEEVREYKSEKYTNYKELERFNTDELRREVAKKTQNEILAAMGGAQNLLSVHYGYAPMKEQVKLQILDSEKHPDYAGFQSAYQTCKTAFISMHPPTPLTGVKELVKPALDYFDQQKDKYDPSEKSGKKLKYACLYNLSLLNFWIEDFDQASKFANAVIANDYDPKDGKHLLEDIEQLKASMEKCGHNTRHFPTEVEADSSEVKAASEAVYDSDKSLRVEAYKDGKKNLSATTVQQEGVLHYTNGEEVRGTFLMDGPERFFEDGANTRFSVDFQNDVRVYVPDYSKISSFNIGDRTFRCMPFKSSNTLYGIAKPGVEIMEVLYESPKIAAYLAYTDVRKGLANPAEYVIYKVADKDMTSLNSMKFALNLNKGLRKEYSDCKAVTDVLDQDGFKRTPAEIVKLAKLIEGCMP